MRQISLLIFLLMALSGCAATHNTTGLDSEEHISPRQAVYYRAIHQWQDTFDRNSVQNLDVPQLESIRAAIARDGWNNKTVEDTIEEIRKLTCPVMETSGHWDTPKEFVANNLQGDCKDIAIFLYAMLKRLDYPKQVRIFAVKTEFIDHAMLKVQMPDNSWKVFDTVKKTEHNTQFVYTPIVEFNDHEIFFAAI
jgi:predicted transglutaminase-like cysteine proteinase